ncbi:MAG: hypothetical protein H6721_01455 [Sandaracinus sp.]|nr:hypothetical protein [Sandaracinus sp.]
MPQPVGTVPQPVGTPTSAAGGSNFGTIALNPGFVPDPHTARGTSGGAIDANTLNPTCRGWISQQPDHLFVAQGAFSNLRFLVNGAGQDTTLVVQRPDGSYMCNDDTEGRDPSSPVASCRARTSSGSAPTRVARASPTRSASASSAA